MSFKFTNTFDNNQQNENVKKSHEMQSEHSDSPNKMNFRRFFAQVCNDTDFFTPFRIEKSNYGQTRTSYGRFTSSNIRLQFLQT